MGDGDGGHLIRQLNRLALLGLLDPGFAVRLDLLFLDRKVLVDLRIVDGSVRLDAPLLDEAVGVDPDFLGFMLAFCFDFRDGGGLVRLGVGFDVFSRLP